MGDFRQFYRATGFMLPPSLDELASWILAVRTRPDDRRDQVAAGS